MKCSGQRSETFPLKCDLKRVLVILLTIISLGAAQTFADETEANAPADEVKKLIKQAGKLARAESIAEAEAVLRRALAIDPNRSATKIELAFVIAKQRRLLEAYNLVFPVADTEPKNARAWSVLGLILLNGGKFEDARVVLFNALKIDRRQHLAWAGFGLLNFYENHVEDGLIDLREAVFHGPNEPDYWFAMAQLSARSERYREAAEAYRQFLRVSSSTDEERRDRITGLVRFLDYLGARDGLYDSIGKEQTVVKFDLVGNRPIINLKVNGRPEPLKFVLDTGSGITVISDETARLMNIRPITRGGFAKGIGGDGRFEIVYGFLRNIEIGEIAVRNVPVYIRKFHSEQQTVDGYIGLALISKFLATIDYGTKTFALTRTAGDRRDFHENSELSLPLRLTSSGFLSGQVQLPGIESPLNFIVDTGASVSVISQRVANTTAISPFVSNERLRVIGSAGITDDVPTFMLPKVSFGAHSREKITAIALNLDLINEASGFEQAGILGGNFLKNYRMTFDFRNSKVLFTSVLPQN